MGEKNIQKTTETAKAKSGQRRQLALWIGALAVGTLAGLLHWGWLDGLMTFVATVYTRLFQLVAVPTIVLALITTLAMFGTQRDTGRIFRHAVVYTLLTTVVAAAVGLVLYNIIRPGNLPTELANAGSAGIPQALGSATYYDHILQVIPANIVKPFLEGNVLSLLLLAFAVGIGLGKLPDSDNKTVLLKGITGLQSLLFLLIKGLIWTLPAGIVAFSAQLSAQVSAGVAAESLGKYIAVILGGNIIQFFVVLPLFLLARGINPVRHLGRMMPAVLMALFTKSSAATLPVTMETAETRAHISKKVSRFVLPICTTINMNGCAAFVLVTSLFVMQNGGFELSVGQMLIWLFISVIVVVMPPVYHPFFLTPQGNHREVVWNPLRMCSEGYYAIDFDALERVCDDKCRLLILCNPHNPGGITWEKETLQRLADFCYERRLLVISDEIHADMAIFGHKHIPFASVSDKAAEISITFQAPTKTFNIAGIISAYAIVPNKKIRDVFYQWMSANELDEAHIFAHIAMIAAYRHGEEWRRQMLRYVEDNIRYVEDFCRENLPGIRPLRPQASFLVWLNCRGLHLGHDQLLDLFVDKAHLALNDGEMFGPGGEGFMRLNVGCSRELVRQALTQLQCALQARIL
jgi:bifunctional pyridoxal-dependent enzyme with beta-cystathionase and maltose regulon repressor activities